ncbi:MAG TPA: CDC27 family protein [Synergistaceae bacterium]|nr:tetratricopeptide repeat protein [Synergistaceae bacterium]NLL41463.1 tetratricopeptide repeat protein [Synergistaceae bacterium]HPX03914.1 CDC27 family protein [Synergistaceae bacterium]HQA54896.1 CDC27 family protein [Synergistaceae bacterium]
MTDNNCAINEEKCPEIVPEEQTGMTKEEQEWGLKKEPRPPLPRYVFGIIAALILIIFLGGSLWYYRTSVLPEKYFQKASAHFKQEEYSEAYILYEKVLKLRPERKNILYQMAFCLEKTGRIDEAIARYEEHLKTIPGDGKALLRMGWLYIQKNDDTGKGLAALKEGAAKLKDPYAWALVSEAALKSKDYETAVEALVKEIELFKEPEQVLTCSKMLMGLGAWEEALKGYERFSELAPDDKRGIHGANAAKAMLGRPTDPRLVIRPGISIGPVRIGDTKDEVRDKLGAPEAKEFRKVGGKSILSDDTAEIWTYSRTMPGRGLRVIFINGKVREVEARSGEYKTETGLGLTNFLLAKNSSRLEWRKEGEDKSVVCLVKGGGLTFYAAGLNSSGTDAKYKKLRVHKGNSSIDSVEGFSLLDLFH